MGKIKSQTIFFENPVYIKENASIVGPKETEGPLGKYFDSHIEDECLGQKSHEKAEIRMHISTIKLLLNKAHLKIDDIDLCFSGDLLDEIIGANFTMREFDVCFMGLYNACATFGEALALGAMMLNAKYANNIICSTSSHFCTAERQYRNPLELGSQRTPLAQWTVTGAGATLLSVESGYAKIDCCTIGKVVDYGVKDVNNMGAAMAPAARSTLVAHFLATGRAPNYYDIILTGDLGEAGSGLLKILMSNEGYDISKNYVDCGVLIFNREAQDVGQGGSGAGCSNVVFNSYVASKIKNGDYKRVLLVPTGALVSKTSGLQGETVPGIAHAISMEAL